MRLSIRDIAILGIYGALMCALQALLSPLPNIEPVSLMILVLASVYGRRAIWSIAVFILLEGLLYGFGLWWFFYLYAWPLLLLLALLLRRVLGRSAWGHALLSGAFGLAFGFLYALLFLAAGGIAGFVATWTAGLLFDLVHCAANIALCLALYTPLVRIMERFGPDAA